MAVATLTSKGQITLPVAVRKKLGLAPGDQVDFVESGEGFALIPVSKHPSVLRGRFAGRVAKPVSVEEMKEAVAEGALARFDKASV